MSHYDQICWPLSGVEAERQQDMKSHYCEASMRASCYVYGKQVSKLLSVCQASEHFLYCKAKRSYLYGKQVKRYLDANENIHGFLPISTIVDQTKCVTPIQTERPNFTQYYHI